MFARQKYDTNVFDEWLSFQCSEVLTAIWPSISGTEEQLWAKDLPSDPKRQPSESGRIRKRCTGFFGFQKSDLINFRLFTDVAQYDPGWCQYIQDLRTKD